MSSQDLTREWLSNVLRPYPSRDRLLPEVLEILKQRRTLAVKTDAFTFDTGHTALLLLLHGTLPIVFRGATYHIPVHVWIPHEYPRGPPLAFVVPTKDMGVRKGREVDPGGRVKEDVVDEWWRSWPEKNIERFLLQLISIFSAVPPVYARPPEQQQNNPAGRSSPSPAPAPASPARPSSQYSEAGPSAFGHSASNQPPPPPIRPNYLPQGIQTENLPQYRPAPTPPPHPHPQQPQPHSRSTSLTYPQSPSNSHPGPSPHSPPVPNRPYQQIPNRQSSQPASPTGPGIPQRPYIPQQSVPILGAGPGPGYENPQRVMTPPRPGPPHSQVGQIQAAGYPNNYGGQSPQPSQQWQQPGYPPNGYHSPSPQALPPQPAQQLPYPQSLPPQSAPPPQTQPQPPRKPIQHDLLSSPDDTDSTIPLPDLSGNNGPPPVPPSKPPPPSLLHLHSILLPHLNASLPPLVQSLQANRQHLIERHEDLVSGEPAIRDEMARLEAVKKVCDSVGRKMDDVVAKGEERVAELEQKGEVSVDEVVCGISIVHNQLIDLVAEDNAIEDTIYHLTRALDAERIDLDRFLKSIRSLAREQYMKRALIERILQGMGQTQGW